MTQSGRAAFASLRRTQEDLAAGAALISLGAGSDRVRLEFEDGAWRLEVRSVGSSSG